MVSLVRFSSTHLRIRTHLRHVCQRRRRRFVTMLLQINIIVLFPCLYIFLEAIGVNSYLVDEFLNKAKRFSPQLLERSSLTGRLDPSEIDPVSRFLSTGLDLRNRRVQDLLEKVFPKRILNERSIIFLYEI